ncbi:MAG: hypothetical protein F4027_03545 [Rhodospirillaceae bacterium]|nr:hypothetical protein [Rhodospirillaceae bacterium]MYH35839.1 hypothetical protein [Rhodospirillaceae bacterium]MYK57711.1 hypothetical protein [Rhodospirillaceae bacterium]
MDADFAGFIALGALILGLFAWLRQDIRALRDEMNGKIDALREEINGKIDALRDEVGELRERVARIEGLLEAMFMRRDLTPLPEPPPSGTPDKSEAA